MSRDVSPLTALTRGLGDVLRAPHLILLAAVLLLIVALPFAAVLESRLQASLSVQPQISLDDTEIDPEWWLDYREHAAGLEATFTPAVLGFAAVLDGISAILDGSRPPTAVLLPLALSLVAWSAIWGGLLRRFDARRAIGARDFVSASAAFVVRFIVIAALAAMANLAVFLTVHRLLFGPVHSALVSMTASEQGAFAIRVVLYLVFYSIVASISLVADYARIAAVQRNLSSPVQCIRVALTFVRGHAGSVALLFVMTGTIFIAGTAAYGALEVIGGSEVGGWRAVAIGQVYVLARVALRLTFAASELRLFTANPTSS